MPHNFVTKIEDIKHRQQRRRLVAACCRTLAAIVIVALALVALDRVLGIQDVVGRVLWTAGFATGCAFIVRKYFWSSLQPPITAYGVAQQVEQQHPELRDVVTSGLEFSGQSEADPWAGSASLRRAIVLNAATGVEAIDWQQLIPRRQLRRSFLAAVGVAFLAAGFAWWAPQSLAIGMTRLLNPLSTAEWPREHDLQFVDAPQQLAAGDDLVLELRDAHGVLPAELTMHYRYWRNQRWHEEAESLTADGESITIRRANLQETLAYRATGGDHRGMPWHDLEVVAPPRVTELQFTAHPPQYTGLPEITFIERGQVYVGSRLRLHGKVDQPLASATLQSASGLHMPLELAADRQSFRLPQDTWCAAQSDTFSLQLTTTKALTTKTPQLLALEVLPDMPPEVRFEQPQQDLTVVPTAEIPLRIHAEDDLAVQDVELIYRRTDRSEAGEFKLPLLRGPKVVQQSTAQRTQQVEYLWQLAALDLVPGCALEVHARAHDYQPALGQTAHSLRLDIVSPAEMLHRMNQRETQVLDEVEQLLQQQRALRASTADWSEAPTAASVNQYLTALFRQRQVTARLVENPDAILRQLTAIRADIRRNQLQRPETEERLRNLQLALRRLAEEPLPALDQTLGKLIRQTQTDTDTTLRQPFYEEIAAHQDVVIATLEQALARLALGEQLGRFERGLQTLSSEQVALQKQCTELVTSQLQSGENADREVIADLASEQRRLARRLAKLLQRMSGAVDQLATQSPAVASRVEQTVAQAQKLGVQATMLQAAEQLGARRLGRASPLQQQAVEQLQKLLAQLTGRDAASAAERIKRMQTIERELQRLQRQVSQMQQEQQQAEPDPRQLERLRRKRAALAKQTEEITRKLERLQARQAAAATRQAADQLRSESSDAEQTKQAKKNLEEAARQLAEQRRRQQVALARLEMARLDAQLARFEKRESAIFEELKRLDALHQAAGQLTPAQEQSVVLLAESQDVLREEIIQMADQIVSLPVFVHLLHTAADGMQQVSDLLRQQNTALLPQQVVSEVLRQLQLLAEAVEQERKNLADDDEQGGGGGGQSGNNAQAQSLQVALGQLKLLKSLQLALQEQTRALESKITAAGQVPEEVLTTARKLAEQQQRLTRAAEQLQPELTDPPPERLFPNLEEELKRP